MNQMMTGALAAIVEAFGELRVNKGRIFLALFGVAFSVGALTAVLGAGGMMRSAIEQGEDTWSGRPATIHIYSFSGDPTPSAREHNDTLILEAATDLGITYRTRVIDNISMSVQTGEGVQVFGIKGVDPDYGVIYRLTPTLGRWFVDSDRARLAPVVVVNSDAYAGLGSPDLYSEPVTIYTSEGQASTVVVAGVVEDSMSNVAPNIYFLVDDAAKAPALAQAARNSTTSYLLWVPPESGDAITQALASRLASASTTGFEVENSVHRRGFLTEGLAGIEWGVIGVSVIVLILGALGLLNIALVTMRFRVREIGIRRSYGATGARIFFGVLMESVVATVVAGAIGVTLAVALLRSPVVTSAMRNFGLVDVPPFPVSAVVIGMSAATLVGILAGAIPAIIATRIRVIDAIRA